MASLLKEHYNQTYTTLLSSALRRVEPSIDPNRLNDDIFTPKFATLSLSERRAHIAKTLHAHLPQDYFKALTILKKVFVQINTPELYLQNMLFSEFVALYGLESFEDSMEALKHFTVNSSSEFAIRVFFIHYEKQTLAKMQEFAKDEDEHIRRLASEGSRPRLPWGKKLQSFVDDPTKTIPILKLLCDDTSGYVRKSVANHLNDISKDHPSFAKTIIKQWYGVQPKRDTMLKHAARTLLKSGDSEMMELFGYHANSDIVMKKFDVDTEVMMGDELHFEVILAASQPLGKIRIEYEMEFVRKNGKTTTKMFHIFSGHVAQKEKKILKTHSFKPITTRKYYAGEHTITLVVNGVAMEQKKFMLHYL